MLLKSYELPVIRGINSVYTVDSLVTIANIVSHT